MLSLVNDLVDKIMIILTKSDHPLSRALGVQWQLPQPRVIPQALVVGSSIVGGPLLLLPLLYNSLYTRACGKGRKGKGKINILKFL